MRWRHRIGDRQRVSMTASVAAACSIVTNARRQRRRGLKPNTVAWLCQLRTGASMMVADQQL